MPTNYNTPYDNQFEDEQVEPQAPIRVPQGKPMIGAGVSTAFGEENIGSQFDPYGGFKDIDRNTSVEDLQDIPEARADAQTGLQLVGHALGQTATELTLGSLESIGYSLDIPGIANSIMGTETEFDNKVSKVFREAKENLNEKYFNIYQSKAALAGNFLDKTSIASNFKNLASTVTLMIPAIGAARGVSLLGKIGEYSRIEGLGAKGLTMEQALVKDAKMLQVAQAVTAASVSRHGEDTMESQQFMSQYRDQLMGKLQPLAEQRTLDRISKLPMVVPYNPERTDNYTEEDRNRDEQKIFSEEKLRLDTEVQDKIVKGANNVYKADGSLLLMDVLQYMPLFQGIGTFAKALSIPKALIVTGQMASEAVEEGTQSMNQMEAYHGISTDTPFMGPGFSERFGEYLKDKDLQTSAVWGAAGAGVFMGLGPAARKIINVGQDFNLNRARAASMGDSHTFNKLTDDVKTDLIKQHAKRDRLDKLDTEFQSMKTQFDEGDWAEMGTTKEEAEKTIDTFGKDIQFAKEQKQIIDNNEFFKDNDAAKNHYLGVLLDHRSNARIMSEIKEENNQIHNEIVKVGEIPTELSQQKKLQIEIEALKNTRKTLKDIPSLAKNDGLRSKVSNNLLLKITMLEAQFNQMMKEYEVINPGTDVKSVLATTQDKKLLHNRQLHEELEIVQNNVLKPTIEAYKSKAFVAEKQKEEKGKETAAKKKTVKETVDTATTVEEVKEAKESTEGEPEVAEVVTSTIKEKAAEQLNTAPKKLNKRYIDAPHLFVEEQNELVAELTRLHKDNPDANVQAEIESLASANNPLEFTKSLGYIMDKASTGNPAMKSLYDNIISIYRDRFDMQDNIVKAAEEVKTDEVITENLVPEEEDVEIAESTSTGSPEVKIESAEEVLPTAIGILKNIVAAMRKFVIDVKTGRILKDAALDKYGTEMNIDFDYVQSPSSFQAGSEVYFIVNTDVTFNKETQDKYHKGFSGKKDSFVNGFQILIAHKDKNGVEHIINALPIYDGKNTSPEAIAIKKLREDIYSLTAASGQKTGIFNTGFSTKVTKKFPGRLVTTKAFNNPHSVLKAGQKLIFGIAVTKGAKTTIEVGKNVSDTRYQSIEIGKQHAGKVFILIEGANGKIVPAMCFTQSIDQAGFEKPKAYVLKYLKSSSPTNWIENRRKIKEVISIDYFYIKEENVFKTKDGTKYTKDQLEAMIAGKLLNVRSSKINTPGYNERISKENRLKTDLKPGENIANANFEFSPEFTRKEVVKSAEDVVVAVVPTEELPPPPVDKMIDENGKMVDYVAPVEEVASSINTQEQLENLVKEITDKRNSLRNINGEVSPENMEEWKALGSQLSIARNATARGNNLGGMVVIKTSPKTATDDPETLVGEDAMNAEQHIENIIMNGIEKGMSTSEIVRRINVHYSFNINEASLLGLYISDRINNSPTVGNNKESFGIWRKGNISSHPSEQVESTEPQKIGGGIDPLTSGLKLRVATETAEEFYEKWDQIAEEKWFKERFGNDKDTLFAIREGLIEINKNGGINAWGMFKDAIAYISSVAATGTTYHEAFHVVFHLYLTDAQRTQILNERPRLGRNDLKIEEDIADEFMEYVQSEEQEIKGLTAKIKDFFKKLYQIIKSGITNDITINDLFYRAQHKMYKNKKFTRDITKFKAERYRLPGISVYQETRRSIALADEMRKVIDDVIKVHPEYASIPRIEIMRAIAKADKTGKAPGIDRILISAHDRLIEYMKNTPELSKEQKDGIKQMLTNFIYVKADGTIGLGHYGKKAIRQFAKTEGVSISTTNREIRAFQELTEDDAVDFGEDQTKAEGWQTKAEEMSGKESLSKEVRKILSYIPKLDKKSGEQEADDLGFTVYHDFNEVYGYLKRELSGILDVNEMIERLAEIAAEKPYMAQILGTVKDSELLKTKFFVDFAKSHVDLKTIKQEALEDETGESIGNRVKILSSNRVMVHRMLVDEWKMNSKDANVNKLLNTDKTINLDKTSKIYKRFQEIRQELKDVAKYGENELTKIKALANYMGISISMSDLISLNIDKEFINDEGELRIQSGKNKVDNLVNKLDTLLASYNANIDPFDASTAETKTIEELSRIVSKFRQEMMESSFRTRRGKETKTIYSHQVPAFLARQINEFKSKNWKEKILFYESTPFYANSPWLKDLAEYENRNAFDFVEIDNLQYMSDNNDSDSIPYVDMSDKDYEFTAMNMFFNNGSEMPYYKFPVVSDAPKMLFIKFKKYEGQAILSALFSVYQQEQARIDDVISREKQRNELIAEGQEIPEELLPIEHYDTEKSKKFLFLPFLNNGHNAKIVGSKNTKEIKTLIGKWLVEEKEKDYARLVEMGVLGENIQLDSRINGKYSDQKAFHADYFYNTVIANTQMMSLFSGDPAFYKADRDSRGIYSRTVDFQKRNKQNVSPALRIDPNAVYTFTEEQAKIEGKPFETVGANYKSIYLKDMKTTSKFNKEILDGLLSTGVSLEEAHQIAAQYGYANTWVVDMGNKDVRYFDNEADAKTLAFENNKQAVAFAGVFEEGFNNPTSIYKTKTINVTDAQAYITPQRFRRVMIGLGRWTKQYQDIYPKMLNGTLSGEELQVVMQPMKPFYFGHSRNGNLIVPVQNKNSEFLLLPQLVKNSPELTKLYNHMTENGVDSANFETAVKVGAYGVQPLSNIEKATIHELNNSDYGLQQETPEHYIDSHTLFGTQIRKLIMSDISPDAMFDVPWSNVKMSKSELFNLYQDIIVEDLREAFGKTKNRIKDLESIEKLLLEEIESREMGEELEKAVKLKDTIDAFGKPTKEFTLPLFHPLHARRIESLLNSVFKNNITKQKINGGAFVQLSAFGFTDKLKLNINPDGSLASAECMLPWWSKKYFAELLDEKGQLDINKVPSNLLEMIGYRIPTEDKYSMLPLKVVGFMPANSGGAVMLPMEITTISGSDFDIDKLYIMMHKFEKFGKDIQKVKYNNKVSVSENSTDARNNAKIDIIRSVLTNKDTFRKLINPGGYAKLSKETDIIKTAEGKIDEMLSIALPSTQTELFRRNMTGKQLVGIFASHNANHAVVQHSLVSLVGGVVFGGHLRQSLHDIYDINGDYVSKNVAEFLAAVVDNAKDPISSFINLNTYTADVAAIILRSGYPISTATRFLSQPILKEFVNLYLNYGGNTAAEKKAKAFIDKKYDNTPGRSIKTTFSEKNGYESPSDEELLAEIESGGHNDNQVWMFKEFMTLKEKGQTLTSLVSAMRADTKGVGPTLSENEALLENIDSVVHSQDLSGQAELFYGNIVGPLVNGSISTQYQAKVFESLSDNFPEGSKIMYFNRESNMIEEATIEKHVFSKYNFEGFFVSDNQDVVGVLDIYSINGVQLQALIEKDNPYKMISGFTTYGVDLPTKELSKFFPWFNKAFKFAKHQLASYTKSNRLNVDQIEKANYGLLAYITSGFEAFNGSDRSEIVNGIAESFKALKEANMEVFENNFFLNKLLVEDTNDASLPRRVSFKNTGSLTSEDKQMVASSWEEAMTSGNPAIKKFAMDLVKYSFYTSGFNVTSNSFWHLTPMEYFKNLTQTLKDGSIESFNKYLERNIEEGKQDRMLYYKWINQFIRNNAHDNDFVPKVDKHFNNITGSVVSIKRDGVNLPVYFEINAWDKSIKDKSLFKLSPLGDEATFPEFLSYKRGGTTYLFKSMDIGPGTTALYVLEEKLGAPNNFIEYSNNSMSPESVIGKNRHFSGKFTKEALEDYAFKKVFKSDLVDNKIKNTDNAHRSIPNDVAVNNDQTLLPKDINIWSTEDNGYEGLSNLAPRSFSHVDPDGITRVYKSVEHAYQTLKNGDVNLDAYNRPEDFVGTKKNAPKLTENGKKVNISVMEDLMTTSFMQNPHSRNLLLETENANLTHTQDNGVWAKEFPRILMQLRSELNKMYRRYTETAKPNETTTSNNPSDYTNHSGGAYGADTFWDTIGREFGVTNHKHYREESNASLSQKLRNTGVQAVKITPAQLEEGYAELERVTGRTYERNLQNNLKARNFFQVKNADAVFAIASGMADKNGKAEAEYQNKGVTGGTNAAVQMAIAAGKAVYVYSVGSYSWYKWNGQFFEQTVTPTLTKNFAGIGTRDIENYSVKNKEGKWASREEYVGDVRANKAKEAIREVYTKTFAKEQPLTSQKSSITKVNYTQELVRKYPNIAFVFTENTHSIENFPDRKGGGSAIIRPEQNAYAIVTKKKYDYNTKENIDYSDTEADFNEFKAINTKLINEIKNSGKSQIVFPKGFATDKATMPTRFAEWLQVELKSNFGLNTKLNETKTGLISLNTEPLTSAKNDVSLSENIQEEDMPKFNQLKAKVILAEELNQRQLDVLSENSLSKDDLYQLQPTINNYGILKRLTC